MNIAGLQTQLAVLPCPSSLVGASLVDALMGPGRAVYSTWGSCLASRLCPPLALPWPLLTTMRPLLTRPWPVPGTNKYSSVSWPCGQLRRIPACWPEFLAPVSVIWPLPWPPLTTIDTGPVRYEDARRFGRFWPLLAAFWKKFSLDSATKRPLLANLPDISLQASPLP